MAQGRSTKTISMIKWTRTIRLSIKISLSLRGAVGVCGANAARTRFTLYSRPEGSGAVSIISDGKAPIPYGLKMYRWPSRDRGSPYHTVDCGLFIKSTDPDAINFKALCGTNLVTLPPIIWGGRNLRSPPSGPQTLIPKTETLIPNPCTLTQRACWRPSDLKRPIND